MPKVYAIDTCSYYIYSLLPPRSRAFRET